MRTLEAEALCVSIARQLEESDIAHGLVAEDAKTRLISPEDEILELLSRHGEFL